MQFDSYNDLPFSFLFTDNINFYFCLKFYPLFKIHRTQVNLFSDWETKKRKKGMDR